MDGCDCWRGDAWEVGSGVDAMIPGEHKIVRTTSLGAKTVVEEGVADSQVNLIMAAGRHGSDVLKPTSGEFGMFWVVDDTGSVFTFSK